jgi:Tfp pilus assembly protein PilZ
MTNVTVASFSFAHDEPPTLIRRRPATLEKRIAARLPIEMDVSVEGAAQRFQATSGDLSSGGMFVVTQRAIPVGAETMLAFTLPNGTSVEVLGIVRWQTCGGAIDAVSGDLSPAGLGLSFFCLAPEVKALLEQFCAARELLYYTSESH